MNVRHIIRETVLNVAVFITLAGLVALWAIA